MGFLFCDLDLPLGLHGVMAKLALEDGSILPARDRQQ